MKHDFSGELVGLAGLPPQQDVDLLLDPVLVVGGVRVRGLLIHQTRQISQLEREIVMKQLEILLLKMTWSMKSKS